MSLSWTNKHVAAMVEVLDADHEDIDSAARAALDAAMEVIATRGKFAVVGQVHWTVEDGEIPPSHPHAVKVCLGLYPSETTANSAAAALAGNTANDRLHVWVVPTFFGTPAAWHKDRRDYYAELEAKADTKRREKLRKDIAKRQEAMQSRADEIAALEATGGGQSWPCPKARSKAGKCKHVPQCK